MEKVCYVVQCSAGSYDDYHTWIAGIYLNALEAEELKLKIIAEIDVVKNIPKPYKEEELKFLTFEQREVYYKWCDENNDANEFNSANVIEYPLGKPVKAD